MRPILSLFEKLRREKLARQKERILVCATNTQAIAFCYVAQQNNFRVDAVMPLQVQANDLQDYSGAVAVQEIPENQRDQYLVVLMLTAKDKNQLITSMNQVGYDAVIFLNNDEVNASISNIFEHSYFADQLGKQLLAGNWQKQIFLLGWNRYTPIIVNVMKMEGYVPSGIVTDEQSSPAEGLCYADIPIISLKSALDKKNALFIETLPPENATDDYIRLTKKNCWKLKLTDLQVINFRWNFLSTFYRLFDFGTPCENFDYEKRSREILSVYDRVTICFMDSERIGNMMETLLFIKQRTDKKNLYAVITRYNNGDNTITFASDKTANNFLLSKIQEACPVITQSQLNFWKYFVQHHAHAVTYNDNFNHYHLRMKQIKKFSLGKYYVETPPIVFSEEEETIGRRKMRDMGLTGEYVTFFNRGHKYLKTLFGENSTNYSHTVRNSSVKNFSLMCRNLYSRGYQSVRMGYLVDGEISGDGIIDYANHYREEFLDYYLIAKSKFFVCAFSGMSPVAMLFHVPLVIINVTSLTLNGDISCHKDPTNETILLPKKLFDTKAQRFITLTEQLEFEVQIPNIYERMDYFKARGFEFIENTPEEIWDAAEEMLLRLEGKLQYTETAQALQERFKSAVDDATKRSPGIIPNGTLISGRFLEKNSYLLM